MTSTLTKKIAAYGTSGLMDMARLLNNDMQDGADDVLAAVLDRLAAMMPEDRFVAFCDELEAA